MDNDRLQKIIARAGICSRRKAEQLIKEGRVTINGEKASIGEKANPIADDIKVDGSKIANKKICKVILLNKPKGVISSCSDPQGRKTVISMLPAQLQTGMHPIGRLDLNSRGAILITNLGELTVHLTHPRYLHAKTYQVWVKGIPSESSLERWRNGLRLDGKYTMKSTVNLLKCTNTKSLLKVILKEGRKRQIRRIADLLDHPVIDLKRTAIGTIELKNLEEGEWRELRPSEWQDLIKKHA